MQINIKFLLCFFLVCVMVALPGVSSGAQENLENGSYLKEVDATVLFPEASTYQGFSSHAEVSVVGGGGARVAVTPQALGYYPGVPTGIGCMGYTERVHKSRGMASVHSGVKGCSQNVEYMGAGAEIMKKGWGVWHRRSFHAKEGKNIRKIDVNSKRICGSSSMQTYRGNGYHRVVYRGKTYIQRTSSDIETRFDCNA